MLGHGFKAKVKRFQQRFLPYRRIRAKTPGLWFTGLLASMGFLTLLSENNILFLLFSCQIAVIIISGIFSEYSVSRIEYIRHARDTYENEASKDQWTLRNRGMIPAFNVSVGEWIDEEWIVHAVCRLIMPGQTLLISSHYKYPKRGHHQWDGTACGSDFPFGFSEKICIDRQSGNRLIWPSRRPGELQSVLQAQLKGFGSNLRDGEIRNLGPGEIWTDLLPFRRNLDGTPLARARGRPEESLSFEIDLDKITESDLENAVQIVASLSAENRLQDLTVRYQKKSQVLRQKRGILDCVALISKTEAPWLQKNAS